MFNKICLIRYPRPRKVVSDNGSEFKRYFTPLLKYYNITTVLMSLKNPKANATVERANQVILKMLVTKDIDNRVFDYIDPWGENQASIAWAIRASYHRTIFSTPGQAVFGIYLLFNLTSVVYWLVITSAKQRQVDIDNVRENSRQVTHDYTIGNRVYVEITGIYRKLYYKKQGPYKRTKSFTNGTVRFQRVQVNEQINIRRFKTHFDE